MRRKLPKAAKTAGFRKNVKPAAYLQLARKNRSDKLKQLDVFRRSAERETRAKLIISNAVKSGKIIQAQAESAEQILANSADFEAEAKKLEDQKPVVKTLPQIDGIEAAEKKRISDGKKAREEIAKLVEEKQENGMTYNEAWNAVKEEKKELFDAAYSDE